MMPTDHVIQSYGEARFKAALDEYMASHATRVQAVIDACKKITNAFIVLTADDDAWRANCARFGSSASKVPELFWHNLINV